MREINQCSVSRLHIRPTLRLSKSSIKTWTSNAQNKQNKQSKDKFKESCARHACLAYRARGRAGSLTLVLTHLDRLHDWQRCHSCFSIKPKLSKINCGPRGKPRGSPPVTFYRLCSTQLTVRLKPDWQFANGQRPIRQLLPSWIGLPYQPLATRGGFSSDEHYSFRGIANYSVTRLACQTIRHVYRVRI